MRGYLDIIFGVHINVDMGSHTDFEGAGYIDIEKIYP